MTHTFIKMHGAGNDFVIIDAREHIVHFTPGQISLISDRHLGVGCDQFIVVRPSEKADVIMDIYNADGSRSGACGNATRCVASLLLDETEKEEVAIETVAGILQAIKEEDGRITVNMGKPRLNWQDIPLAKEQDTLHVQMGLEELQDPVGVSMGNPHIVFFVADVEKVDLHLLGPVLEHHMLLPERANIGIAQVVDRHTMKLRVWERGCGETLACGSGACAAMVAASRRGLIGRQVDIDLPGGRLTIAWEGSDHVLMTGPVAAVFTGLLDSSFY